MRSGGTPNLASTPFGSSDLVRHRVHPRDALAHELREVLVARGDEGVPAVHPLGVAREGADHVVGLDAVDHDQGPAERADRLEERRDLGGEVLGHRLPRGLVLGVDLVAEGLSLGIEDRGDIIGGVVRRELPQHVHHAHDRARGLARGAAELRHRVEGAIEVARGVDEQQALLRIVHVTALGPAMHSKIPKPSDPQLVHASQSSAREAWRMFEIIAEFVTATERLRAIHPAVTIFGSARAKPGRARLPAGRGHRAAGYRTRASPSSPAAAPASWRRPTRAPSREPAPAWGSTSSSRTSSTPTPTRTSRTPSSTSSRAR